MNKLDKPVFEHRDDVIRVSFNNIYHKNFIETGPDYVGKIAVLAMFDKDGNIAKAEKLPGLMNSYEQNGELHLEFAKDKKSAFRGEVSDYVPPAREDTEDIINKWYESVINMQRLRNERLEREMMERREMEKERQDGRSVPPGLNVAFTHGIKLKPPVLTTVPKQKSQGMVGRTSQTSNLTPPSQSSDFYRGAEDFQRPTNRGSASNENNTSVGISIPGFNMKFRLNLHVEVGDRKFDANTDKSISVTGKIGNFINRGIEGYRDASNSMKETIGKALDSVYNNKLVQNVKSSQLYQAAGQATTKVYTEEKKIFTEVNKTLGSIRDKIGKTISDFRRKSSETRLNSENGLFRGAGYGVAIGGAVVGTGAMLTAATPMMGLDTVTAAHFLELGQAFGGGMFIGGMAGGATGAIIGGIAGGLNDVRHFIKDSIKISDVSKENVKEAGRSSMAGAASGINKESEYGIDGMMQGKSFRGNNGMSAGHSGGMSFASQSGGVIPPQPHFMSQASPVNKNVKIDGELDFNPSIEGPRHSIYNGKKVISFRLSKECVEGINGVKHIEPIVSPNKSRGDDGKALSLVSYDKDGKKCGYDNMPGLIGYKKSGDKVIVSFLTEIDRHGNGRYTGAITENTAKNMLQNFSSGIKNYWDNVNSKRQTAKQTNDITQSQTRSNNRGIAQGM